VDAKNNSCACNISTLKWNSSGFCDCGAGSVMIVNGTSYSCFICNNITANTNAKQDSYTCSCITSALTWNATTRTCGCSAAGAIVSGTGSSATCFTCPQAGYVTGTSADHTSCACMGRLVWLSATSTCGCSNNSQAIVGSGATLQCVVCSSLQYGGATTTSATVCSCLGTGLTFNSSNVGSCSCPTTSILLPSFTCLACPAGATPLTVYECLCPPNSIWSYDKTNCAQCGTADVPNSLSTGGTNLACLCNVGYTWDVMTQSCILSTTCATVTASCMKCSSGTASSLNSTAARNLFEGSTVQNLLNGTFTNYNQIKGFQCKCNTGFSWDSLRLRCYTTGLQ
jgi:hypothetical protein